MHVSLFSGVAVSTSLSVRYMCGLALHVTLFAGVDVSPNVGERGGEALPGSVQPALRDAPLRAVYQGELRFSFVHSLVLNCGFLRMCYACWALT